MKLGLIPSSGSSPKGLVSFPALVPVQRLWESNSWSHSQLWFQSKGSGNRTLGLIPSSGSSPKGLGIELLVSFPVPRDALDLGIQLAQRVSRELHGTLCDCPSSSVHSVAYQRLSWEALKKSINGLINKVLSGVPHFCSCERKLAVGGRSGWKALVRG